MEKTTTSPASSPVLHVFVATNETQGKRKNDFCHATVGELIRFGTECDGERVDGRCGCRRSFTGMISLKATTTFKVAALQMSVSEFVDALRESYKASGWGKFLDRIDVLAKANELLRLAASFPVGTVVEKRGNAIQSR